jgi:hypothetical protein
MLHLGADSSILPLMCWQGLSWGCKTADTVVKNTLFTHQNTQSALNYVVSMLALSRGLPRRVLPLVQFATTATLQSNESCKSVHTAFSNLHTYSRLLPEPARARQLHLQQHSWCRQISSSMVSKLPPLSSIETATLKRKDGTEIHAKMLWETTPVFIYCIRRPGW